MSTELGRTPSTTASLVGYSIFVLAESVSAVGGAPKLTRLLVETLAKLFSRVTLFVSSCPDRDTTRALEARDIRVIPPLLRRGSRWQIQHRSIAFQLFLGAKRHSPALVHSVGLTAAARHLLALPAVAPILLWETTEALPHVKFVDKRISQVADRAAAILAPSQTIARNLRLTYGYQGDVRILPFWVEAPLAQRSHPHARTRNIMFVGRLDIDKGFEFLFQAFRRTLASEPRATLTVCGSGPVTPIRNLAGSTREIDVRGYVESSEYERLMLRCDALVLPSLHEGYPLSLLEACGRCKPVVASRVGSIPEVFDGKACAILVEPRDVSGLDRAFREILGESDSDYARRQASALSLFESLNSEPIIRERLLTAYQPELSRRAGSAQARVSS